MTPRHTSYNEACRDVTATPIERETALLKEYSIALREIEWLCDRCRRLDGIIADNNATIEKVVEARMTYRQTGATMDLFDFLRRIDDLAKTLSAATSAGSARLDTPAQPSQ